MSATNSHQGKGGHIIVSGEEVFIPDVKIVTFKRGGDGFEGKIGEESGRELTRPRKVKTEKGLLRTRAAEHVRERVDMIILHADITHDSAQCFRVLYNRGLSSHFGIDWDGTIYQWSDTASLTMHAGPWNNRSIGIDLNCMLVNHLRNPNANKGKGERPTAQMEIQGNPWMSVGYTDEQYEAVIALIATLKEQYPKIDLAVPVTEDGEVVPHFIPDVDGGGRAEKVGIYGHWHISPEKADPGPAFDWRRLVSGLTGRSNAFPVTWTRKQQRANWRNKREIQRLAAQYYKRNEINNDSGGFFPVGIEATWHGGIHLPIRVGGQVRAMLDGVVVAARNGPIPAGGSNNFVLLRHEIDFDPREDKERKFVFYTLYMHLQRFAMDPETLKAKKLKDGLARMPEWFAMLAKVDKGEDELPEDEEDEEADDYDDEGNKKKKRKKRRRKKKKKKKAKKKKPADKGDDDDDDDIHFGDDDDEDDEDGHIDGPVTDEEMAGCADSDLSRVTNTNGEGATALRAGSVALLPTEGADAVLVKAGKVLGHVGPLLGEGGESCEGAVHVEVFADGRWRDAVDLVGQHGAHWLEFDADPNPTLQIDTDDVWAVVLQGDDERGRVIRGDFLSEDRRVDEETIREFYGETGPEAERLKRRLRKAITRHVSEWSDQVDWFRSLAEAQDDKDVGKAIEKNLLKDDQGRLLKTLFARQIQRFTPYIWLTQEVAEHVGLQFGDKWDGVLYHFHPIHFLEWITFETTRTQGKVFTRMNKSEIRKERRKHRREQERIRKEARGKLDPDLLEDDHGDAFVVDEIDELANPTSVLDELWEAGEFADEWERRD